MYSPGVVAFLPLDSVSTQTVNGKVNGILNANLWTKFKSATPPNTTPPNKGTTCAAVFAEGIPSIWAGGADPLFTTYDKELKAVQVRQSTLNFYDTGNPVVANYHLDVVTAGLIKNPVKLINYVTNAVATAATSSSGNRAHRAHAEVLRPIGCAVPTGNSNSRSTSSCVCRHNRRPDTWEDGVSVLPNQGVV